MGCCCSYRVYPRYEDLSYDEKVAIDKHRYVENLPRMTDRDMEIYENIDANIRKRMHAQTVATYDINPVTGKKQTLNANPWW
jgi:hypothetical protein